MSSYEVGLFYVIKLTVDNSVGAVESDSTVFLLADLPGQPSAPVRVSDGKQVTIVMSAPLQDGGSQLINY